MYIDIACPWCVCVCVWLQHPGHSCASHPLSIVPGTYLRALGVYLPVYLLPALLVHRCVVFYITRHAVLSIVGGKRCTS